MKKITIIFLMILSVSAFSQDWLELHGFLESGYFTRALDSASMQINDRKKNLSFYTYDNLFYVTLNSYLQVFNVVQIGGEIRSIFDFKEITKTSPVLNRYTFFMKIVFDNIELGFSHYCEHDTTINQYFDDNKLLDRGEEKIYIKFIF